MSKRRVTYRPSKGQAIFSSVVGGLFVLLGIFMVIPTFGLFGVIWTAIAGGIMGMNLYQAFGKGYVGPQIQIEEEGSAPAAPSGSSQQRLKELRSLYDQHLITREEYDAKRQEIIKDL